MCDTVVAIVLVKPSRPQAAASVRFHNPSSTGEECRVLFTCHAMHPIHCLVAVIKEVLKNVAVIWQSDSKCDIITTALQEMLVCLRLESKISHTDLFFKSLRKKHIVKDALQK